jgi:lipopolysaccharide transport system ATP-binding protein
MPEMKSENAIEVHGLSKCFQKAEGGSDSAEFWALRDVSFSVKRGDSVGIFGPNGSGKSTLLKILAGVTKPTSGTVSMRGRIASILDIGAGFHPELSGRKNIYLNSSVLGFSKRETLKREQDIIEFSGISEFIDEPVKNYSNGMFIRLAFSILANLDFDVYLFDEVFSAGDAKFEAKVNKTLRSLIESEKTVVLVSHQMSALERQNSFLHLSEGVLQSYNRKREILVNYLTDSVIGPENRLSISTADVVVREFRETAEHPELRLLEVRLHQPDNKNEEFRTDRDFILEVLYEKIDDQNTLDMLVSVSDLHDSEVFFTSPLVSSSPSEWTDPGCYRLQCIIPASTFNSRIFALNITFLKNTKSNLSRFNENEHFREQNLISEGGIEICCSLRSVILFKPVYRSANVSLDLSRFEISCNLVPAFKWKQTKC